MFNKVLTLMSGVAGAQLLSLIFVPIITRIYGPELFGIFGVYTAFILMIGPVICLSLPIANVVVKKELQSLLILKVSFVVSLMLTFFISGVVVTYGAMTRFEGLSKYALLLPIGLITFSMYQITYYYAIRVQGFKEIAISNIGKVLFDSSLKIAISLFIVSSITLILVTSLSYAVFALIFFILIKSDLFQKLVEVKVTRKKFFYVLKKQKSYILHRTPQHLLNHGSQSLPLLLFALMFEPEMVGYLTLALLIISAPTQLISKAISDVYFSELARLASSGHSIFKRLLMANINLGLFALVPLLIVIVKGPELFEFIFGSQWRQSGYFATVLSIWIYSVFCTTLSVAVLPIIKRQDILLYYSIAKVIVRLLSLTITFIVVGEPLVVILIYSISGFFLNVLLFIHVIKLASKFDDERLCAH